MDEENEQKEEYQGFFQPSLAEQKFIFTLKHKIDELQSFYDKQEPHFNYMIFY